MTSGKSTESLANSALARNLKKVFEFNYLSTEQKWQYLRAYWSKASKFYALRQELIVPDEEVHAQIRKFKPKPLPKIRRIIDLREWRWKLDPDLKGIEEGYFKHDFSDSTWEKIAVPHNVHYIPTPSEFGTIDYRIHNAPFDDRPITIYLGKYALWYRTSVPLRTKELEGKKAFLKFESCSIKTSAWVDEWPVILEHYGVYPFEMEITEELRKSPNDEKQIVLDIVSTPSNVPDLFYAIFQDAYAEKRGDPAIENAPLAWGGINGSVELVITSSIYIKDVFIHTREVQGDKAILHARFELENTTREPFEGQLAVDIKRWYPQEESREEQLTFDVHARPLATTVVEKEIELRDPVLWGSWNPNLYLAHVTLAREGRPCDDVYETFGVRTFTAKDGKFFLNGQPITLAGLHDSVVYPDTSPTCPGDYWIVQDILLTKAVGMVAARYPSDNRNHYRRIAEYADQMGLMLIWEGYCSMWNQDPGIDDLASRDIPAMVRDLRNHPSIIAWTLGDETFFFLDETRSTLENKRFHYYELTYRLVADKDPSRLINPVGHWAEDLTDIIESYTRQGLKLEDAQRKALELFPVFTLPNTYWSIHSIPSGINTDPVYANMRRYHKMICGIGIPVTFDEWGCEGMPNWELSKGEWWHKRWTLTPYFMHGKKFLEPALLGKEFSIDDWNLSQAYQALVMWRVMSYIRESGAFAGFSPLCPRDCGNMYTGFVDARGRGKLAFFVLRNMLQHFFISAMHGNFAFEHGDKLPITISNNGPELKDGELLITVTDEKGKIVDEKAISHLRITEGTSKVSDYDTSHLPNGLYAFEYLLQDSNHNALGRSLEMFFTVP